MLQPWSKPPTFLGLWGNSVDIPPHSVRELSMPGFSHGGGTTLLHSDNSQAINGKSGASS